ncbi:hypothetical protein PV325_007836 [Microctonus aethiopoides]|uniref:Pre-C2HC domain-containing protein n=1 Tax=Microctonus aethiopoides TaxID=144406 RepID=A0AA39C439_9HYME|nr:hypothetical protein PV325_007836 [Microctonus aethiopoides]KAK0157234.1 hypothetical protein PV328_011713 [Microctonus aethiopoides]
MCVYETHISFKKFSSYADSECSEYMGSVETPKINTDVFPQSTDVFPQSTVRFSVPHQERDQLNYEGSVKRKRACKKTTDNPSSKCKKKAYDDDDDDEIFSDNNVDTKVTYECNGNYVAIVPKKIEAHDKIIEVLKSEEAEFHTYARKSEIKPKIVLKGLPVLPVEVTSNEIHSLNIKTNNIYMLRAKTNNNLNSATYLVTVDNLTTLNEIIKIKYIYCIATNPNIKCHNCGENHMANDEKCPVYIRFINNKTNNINNQNKKNPINTQPMNSYPNNNACNTHKTCSPGEIGA